MKRILLSGTIVLLAVFSSSLSYGQSWDWGKDDSLMSVNAFGDLTPDHTVSVDNHGNAYMVGYFAGKIRFGSYILKAHSNISEVFLTKYDANGNLLWVKQIKESVHGESEGTSIAVDNTGNVCITGYFQDSLSFGAVTLITKGYTNVFIAKYDANGNLLWANQPNIASSECFAYSYSIALDQLGDSYITGSYGDTIQFGANILMGLINAENVFIAKYNAAGNPIWAKQGVVSSTASFGVGNSVAVDTTGNPFITGNFADSISFGSNKLVTKNDLSDMFLAKYDSVGSILWVKQSTQQSSDCWGYGNSIAADRNGDVYITGNFVDTMSFGTKILTDSIANPDAFLVKYDGSNGSVVWAVAGDNLNYFQAWHGFSVACDTLKKGGGYLTIEGDGGAVMQCKLKFGNDTFNYNTFHSTGTIIMQFDSSGKILCGTVFTEGNEDDGDGVGVSHSGQYVYIAGDLDDSLVAFGPDTLQYGGNDAPFIARWQTCSPGEGQGISEIKPNETIAVYPNPFHNSTNIAVNSDGTHYLEVDDITGRKLEFIKFTGKQCELSSQGLAKGMYFVRVFDETNILIGTSKIVVQ